MSEPPRCTHAVRELLASHELSMLSREERRRVEEHVLECDACFEDAYRFAPVAAALREADAAPELETALEADAVRPAARRRAMVPLLAAAAAVLVGGLVSAAFLVLPRGPSSDDGGQLRGGTQAQLVVVAPSGRGPRPTQLEWAPVPAAVSHVVRVREAGGQVAWEREVARSPAIVPEEVRARLRAGATYSWEVEAIGPDGERWTSGPTRFTVVK